MDGGKGPGQHPKKFILLAVIKVLICISFQSRARY